MRIALYLITLLFILPNDVFCETKPPAPPELIEIMEQFSEVEEHFEDNDWDQSLEHIDAANALVGKILPDIRKHASRKELKNFRVKFLELRNQIRSKNSNFALASYIELQIAYFILSENFELETPLFLITVGKYIDEAAEAYEKNDLEDISAEMIEISEFVESFGRILISHGIEDDPIEEFLVTALRIRRSAERKKKKKKIGEGIENLRRLHAEFTEMYQ